MDYVDNDFKELNLSSELDTIKLFYTNIEEHINNYNNKFKNLNSKIVSLMGKQYLDKKLFFRFIKISKKLS